VARLGGKTKCMQGIGGKAERTESLQKTEAYRILDGSEITFLCCGCVALWGVTWRFLTCFIK
jgi:hypothetical protein